MREALVRVLALRYSAAYRLCTLYPIPPVTRTPERVCWSSSDRSVSGQALLAEPFPIASHVCVLGLHNRTGADLFDDPETGWFCIPSRTGSSFHTLATADLTHTQTGSAARRRHAVQTRA
jgi:hypothetical protein